jgi:hypothetical protein
MELGISGGVVKAGQNREQFALSRCGSQIVEGYPGRKPLRILEAGEMGVQFAPFLKSKRRFWLRVAIEQKESRP